MLSHSGGAIDGQDAMQLMNDLIAEPSFAALLEKHGMSFTVNPPIATSRCSKPAATRWKPRRRTTF